MGILRSDRLRPARLGQRGTVLTAITVMHVLAVAALVNMGTGWVSKAEDPPRLQAVFLRADSQIRQPPRLQPELDPPPVEVPRVETPVILMPAANSSITVAKVRDNPPPVAAAAQFVDADVPVAIESVDYLQKVEPRYPPLAKRARAQGIVYLYVIIGPDGRPREVRVHRSSGYELLDAAAREAVRKSLFRPYRENGVARSASVTVPVQFSLTSRSS